MKLAFKIHPGKHNNNGITIILSSTLYESEVQHSTHHQMMGAYDCNGEKIIIMHRKLCSDIRFDNAMQHLVSNMAIFANTVKHY